MPDKLPADHDHVSAFEKIRRVNDGDTSARGAAATVEVTEGERLRRIWAFYRFGADGANKTIRQETDMHSIIAIIHVSRCAVRHPARR